MTEYREQGISIGVSDPERDPEPIRVAFRDIILCLSPEQAVALAADLGRAVCGVASKREPLPGRCPVCDWPLAKNASEGCVPGNCCYRPDDPGERERLRVRREWLKLMGGHHG